MLNQTPSYCFGKLPPNASQLARTLKMGSFLTSALAAPVPSYSSLSRVLANLKTTLVTGLFPMDGNDVLGDCTIAALAHFDTMFQGLIGKEAIMQKAAVEALYFKLTGGRDTGLVVLQVLNYWRKNKVNGGSILAYVSIDPKNHEHVQQAIPLFGGVYIGFQVTQGLTHQFDNGQPWTPGTLTGEGHAVPVVAYDQQTVEVLTWGDTQLGTWGWWDQCVDECYAIVPPEANSKTFAPGFDLAQLEAALKLV